VEAFLAAIGSKLTDRWLAALALPGLLFVGLGLVAVNLQQAHALSTGTLIRRAAHASAEVRAYGPTALLIAVIAALLLATAAALAAGWLGFAIQALWLGAWHGPLARQLTASRRKRWTRADDAMTDDEERIRESGAEADPAERDRLAAARNRIALAVPERPTWTGDRAHAVDVRVWSWHGLDLTTAWPRLWLLASDASRAEVTAARAAISGAATVAGWGLMYAVLAVAWWPAALVALVTMCTGWYRVRAAVAGFADLVEAVVDLNARPLAVAVGALGDGDAFTRDVGLEVTKRVRKGT
jgi:hypothetical protein